MEWHSGVFIASTNLMEGLDQAALRRFDIKTKFGYLKPEQAWALFRKLCDSLGLDIGTDCQQALDQLAFLTPGDFAVIARRHRFQPFPDGASVILGLDEECQLKEEAKPHRSIGFV
jgi:SpoVK/Ycf46/Vps4 family AAA+-type ATPase